MLHVAIPVHCSIREPHCPAILAVKSSQPSDANSLFFQVDQEVALIRDTVMTTLRADQQQIVVEYKQQVGKDLHVSSLHSTFKLQSHRPLTRWIWLKTHNLITDNRT